MATQNNEMLKGSPNEKITINSQEEFKRKLNISNLPDTDLKEYFTEPLETTRGELMELRKKYLEGEPNTDSLKSFLVERKNKILDTAKKQAEKLKEVTGDIKKSLNIEKQKNQEGIIDSNQAEKTADKALESIENVKENAGEKATIVGNKAKDLTNKAKETVKKGTDALKVGDFIKLLEETKEDGGILGFFAGILLFLLKLVGYGKLEETKEMIKQKLNPEEIEKTKEAVRKTIINSYPKSEEYVNKILENPKIITEEKIRTLYEKIKSGEKLTLSDLKDEFKELDIEKFLKEKKDQTIELLYKEIQEEIEKKYDKSLDDGQVIELRRLIETKLKIGNNNIERLEQRIIKDNQIQVKDVMPILSEIGASSVSFIIGLVTSNIISASDIALEIAYKGVNVMKLSIGALGLSETINIENIYKDFDGLGDTEKAVLIGLLYRKGGIFLNLVGNLSAGISRLTLETILPTNSGVDGFKILKDGFSDNANLKQIQNFEKIEKALIGTKEIPEGTTILKESIQNVNDVKKNFITIEMFEKSNGDVNKFYELVNEYETKSNIKLNLKKFNTFDELKNGLSEIFSSGYTSKTNGSIRNIKNKALGFGLESAIHDLNKQIEVIKNNQARIVLGKLNLSPFKKITDVIDLSKISRLGDRFLFELRSKDEAKAFAKQMNELAKQSPKLISAIFDKLPIIAVTGLAASGEDDFLKSMQNEMPYLLPLVGPILMIADSGVEWSGFNPKFIKPEQTLIAGALLTVDGFFGLREFQKGGFTGLGKYLAKPIKDVYEIGKGTVEIGQKLYRGGSVFNKELVVKAVEKTKLIKGKARLIAIIGMIGIGAFEIAYAGDDKLKDYFKDGKLDQEKIKQDSDELSLTEKTEVIKMIFLEEYNEKTIEGIDFKLNSNKSLEITSINEKIQSDWIINNDIKDNLNNLLGIDKFDFIYKQKTA
ncbi:MAG: hypothetical protein PHS49_05860 [Candidatus Gracilibacteria bacterium]|nr:hypothetical protein [Candidatus Gracilibacteria bacterium]